MAKKLLLLLVVGFAVFYVLSRPESAAASVQTAMGGIGEAFEQLTRFVTSLVR